MSESPATGVRRLINALYYTRAGIAAAWRTQEAFRQEVLLGVVLTPLAMWLGAGVVERVLLLASLLLVLIVELLNSGIEAVVDRIGSEHHELAGRAKDMGSAAVFLALVNVVMIWTIVLFTT
jgi:diacylglycerol kinase (ATP)